MSDYLKEASWEAIARTLGLDLDELKELAEKDPVACLDKVETSVRQRAMVNAEKIRNLQSYNGQPLGAIFKAFQADVKPTHLQTFVNAKQATLKWDEFGEAWQNQCNVLAQYSDCAVLLGKMGWWAKRARQNKGKIEVKPEPKEEETPEETTKKKPSVMDEIIAQAKAEAEKEGNTDGTD